MTTINFAKIPIQSICDYVNNNHEKLNKKTIKYINNFMNHEIKCMNVEKNIKKYETHVLPTTDSIKKTIETSKSVSQIPKQIMIPSLTTSLTKPTKSTQKLPKTIADFALQLKY